MAKFDSKSFNAEAFGAYVDRVPNTKKSELAKSGAIGANENARKALSSQTGSLYARIPFFGRINGGTSQNNDGATDITSSSTTTFEQGYIVASRMDSWTERSFSKNITAGVDFMDNVAAQIADYKLEVKQAIILAILEGIYSMTTTGNTVAARAAKEFVEKHTFDISNKSGDNAFVGAGTLNKAIQRACGDNKEIFKLAFMHSETATNLENLKLLKYFTYTDKDGITRELALGSWNGRTVVVDDGMPAVEGYYDAASTDEGAIKLVANNATPSDGEMKLNAVTNYFGEKTLAADDYVIPGTQYVTYVLGEGAVNVDDIGDAVPYEMSRNAAKNGGEDTLYVRDRYILGVDGISFEKPASITASPTNAELATGTNWNVVNDGTNSISHKAIAITRILSKG